METVELPKERSLASSQPEEIVVTNGLRKRWRRNRVACDSCHSRRVKCDRAFPCARCVGSRIRCELTRERRKRGRIPRNGLQSREVAAAAVMTEKNISNEHTSVSEIPPGTATTMASPMQNDSPVSNICRSPAGANLSQSAPSIGEHHSVPDLQPSPKETVVGNGSDYMMSISNGFQVPYSYDLFGDMGLPDGPLSVPLEMMGTAEISGYQLLRSVSRQRIASSLGPSAGEPPLKYQVLQPLMPFLEPYLSRSLVYELLELYFTSAFSTITHPVCHHIHSYIIRKASVLSPDNPRSTSPALLASMLWVAALDDRAFALSISPTKRRKICQFLCALTVRLLRPLIHVSFKGENISGEREYVSPAASHDRTHSFEEGGDDRGLVGPAGSLDDIIAYIHVASIVSASEQKAASMRWWHAAFTLARELRLNQEVEATPNLDSSMESTCRTFDFTDSTGFGSFSNPDYAHPDRPSLNCVCDRRHRPNMMTEEHREERRRAWWLLYIMDRHLALCYNRPLALLDAECEELLLPLEEGLWQAGDVHSNSPKPDGPQCLLTGEKTKRRVFPNFVCTDHSIFGYFLPLMTITGELINLNQAKNHPMLGIRLQGKEAWDIQVSEVLRQLDLYKSTLPTFAAHPTPPANGPEPVPPPPTSLSPAMVPEPPSVVEASGWHHQTVVAYASYVVHVLHILLVGKWDPVSLLEDKDFWTSSPAFAKTISHALGAADVLEQILHYDPDISFMPYFFGIQLLQGSFLLLLIVERLQKEAGEGILKACEVVIRATESCVVTLNTEYQRNFRQVMRSAVAQARGRPVNHSEIRHRRKAVLALYRWTRNGTGLAL